MTTIVYRDNIMAADSRAYSGGPAPIGFKQKIHRLDGGSLVGVSSSEPGQPETVLKFLKGELDWDQAAGMIGEPNFSALRVAPDGNVFLYENCGIPSGPLYGEYFAVGSGRQFAIGALTCGATADGALQVAIMNDIWSGGSIYLLALHGEVEGQNVAADVEPGIGKAA